MHFIAFVITQQKPTEEILPTALNPFFNEHFDWFALGGRYTGMIEPFDHEDTVTGGMDMPAVEEWLHTHSNGIIPQCRGPGVDAAPLDNIKKLPTRPPAAVVVDGEWHQCEPTPLFDAKSLAESIGVDTEFKLRGGDQGRSVAERDIWLRWLDQAELLISQAPDTHWLSVVDCHR